MGGYLMSRKPHLVALSDQELTAYKHRLLHEHASCLAELELRRRLDDCYIKAGGVANLRTADGTQLRLLEPEST